MDDETKQDGEEVMLPEGVLEEALGDEVDDEEEAADPLAAIDEFGGGGDFDGKQWE